MDQEWDVSEGCSSPEKHKSNGLCSFTDSVTMETTEQSETAPATEYEVELDTAESPEQQQDISADDDLACLDSSDTEEKATPDTEDIPASEMSELDKPDSLEDGQCSNMPCTDQKEALILDVGHVELNRNESINSSVSDTLSSADSVYENQAHCKRQDTQEHDLELQPEPQPEANEPSPENNGYRNIALETEENTVVYIPFDQPITDITEESILEQYIREEAMSDVSNESCHDLYPDEIDECLRVEIAAVSSDSDTDEKWRTIFSSSINKEDDDSYLDSLQLSAQELFVQKVEVIDIEEEDDNNAEEALPEIPQEEEVLEQPNDIISFPAPPQEVTYNPLGVQSLSNISEDSSENGKDAIHNHTIVYHQQSQLPKKLPKDFCVIQETKSENVSTEHVDFQLARKQWLEMEEQTKNQIVSPTTKHPSFHGSHSFMYTPVRNVERPHKKDHDLENLSLVGDYPLTQFSPCSEDSGLDDSSYRSPCDDPETSIEKEIRAAIQREDNFRKEKGFSKMGKSTDCAPSRMIPRSASTPLTPSFIITSSPSKAPLTEEMSTNNIIILEPSDDFPCTPIYGEDILMAHSSDWRSNDSNANLIILETSNLIIRSASEFCLNKVCDQPQEKMFLNNPFFKLRSRSTMSLVDEEIKQVKQREEELKKERARLYGKELFNTGMMVPNHMGFDNSAEIPEKCKSSPSSPMKTAYKMYRSTLSCDYRYYHLKEEGGEGGALKAGQQSNRFSQFPDGYTSGRRKSAMALRWEAGEFTKND